MNFTPQPTFLLALQEIMKTDVAAVALTVEEIFFIANDLCPKDQRIRYGAYLKFIDSLNEYGEPTLDLDKAELYLDIEDYIKAQQAKQRLAMLNGIMEAGKDWRRFQWLLQWQEKQERQDNLQARKLAKAEKEKQQALNALTQYAEASTDEQPSQVPNQNPNQQPSYHEQQRLSKVN